MTALACVATTTRIFLPSPQNPVYLPGQAEPVLAQYLHLQCPAFRKAALPDTGVVHFAVAVTATGQATRAELLAGSGDQLVDEVFGTIAAQLTLPADSTRPGPRTLPVRMAFSCRGDSVNVRIR
ncbi:MAG: hypothetical protein IPK85_12340 [Gemmatimonadetes bacterium]|nr:hypothetical protein [Gemmatimonadota bacterium]